MLTNSPVMPTIPVTDINRAIDFYTNKLGLKRASKEVEKDAALFDAGEGTMLYLYQRPPSHAEHTLASFMVENLAQTMDELSKAGVTFEHYDMPGLKTDEKGVVANEGMKACWFKDPDGNILGIVESK
jgi:catechol 2,3-dioxygenase-like lactoylglutathione lyase family enzyme